MSLQPQDNEKRNNDFFIQNIVIKIKELISDFFFYDIDTEGVCVLG
jgi:hypothetical protein